MTVSLSKQCIILGMCKFIRQYIVAITISDVLEAVSFFEAEARTRQKAISHKIPEKRIAEYE